MVGVGGGSGGWNRGGVMGCYTVVQKQCYQNNFCNILSSQQSYPNFSVPKNPKKSKHSFYQKME